MSDILFQLDLALTDESLDPLIKPIFPLTGNSVDPFI